MKRRRGAALLEQGHAVLQSEHVLLLAAAHRERARGDFSRADNRDERCGGVVGFGDTPCERFIASVGTRA
jgi:hypothetical protein